MNIGEFYGGYIELVAGLLNQLIAEPSFTVVSSYNNYLPTQTFSNNVSEMVAWQPKGGFTGPRWQWRVPPKIRGELETIHLELERCVISSDFVFCFQEAPNPTFCAKPCHEVPKMTRFMTCSSFRSQNPPFLDVHREFRPQYPPFFRKFSSPGTRVLNGFF